MSLAFLATRPGYALQVDLWGRSARVGNEWGSVLLGSRLRTESVAIQKLAAISRKLLILLNGGGGGVEPIRAIENTQVANFSIPLIPRMPWFPSTFAQFCTIVPLTKCGQNPKPREGLVGQNAKSLRELTVRRSRPRAPATPPCTEETWQ